MITLSDEEIESLKPTPRESIPEYTGIAVDEQESLRELNFGNKNAPEIEGPNPYLDELAVEAQNIPRDLGRDALQINNVTTNLAYWYEDSNQNFEEQIDYDPYRDDRELFNQIDLDSRERMYEAKSPQELRYILKRIDGERRARQNIDEHGTEGLLASIAAGLGDPINFIPLIGVATKGSLAYRAATAAISTAASTGAEELIMHQAQNDRTIEESAINIGTGAAFVGILSGVMSKYNARSPALKELELEIKSKTDEPDIVAPTPEFKGVGAAPTINPSVLEWDKNTLVPVGGVVTKAATFGPLGGLAGSLLFNPITAVKKLTNELFDHGLTLRGHKAGLAEISVESNIARVKNTMADEILTAKKRGLAGFIESTGKTADEFYALVQRSVRYGDVIDPWVRHAADPIIMALRDIGGVLHKFEKITNPDNVFGSLHFFPRDYRKIVMRANPNETIDNIANKLYKRWEGNEKEMQKVIEDSMNADVYASPAEVMFAVKQEAREIAERVYQNIIDGANEFPATTSRRKLRLEDEDLMDLLEQDPYITVLKYIERTVPKAVLLKKYGTWNIEKIIQLSGIEDEAMELRKAAKTGDDALKIDKKIKRARELLETGHNRMLGIRSQTGLSKRTDSWFSAYSKFMVSTKMGGALISSLNDVGNTVMANGPIKTMKYYVKGIIDVFDDSGLTKAQAKSLGSAFEEMSSGRMKQVMDLLDEPTTDPVNEWMSVITNKLMQVSGLPAWNRFGQDVAASIGVDKIIEAAEKLNAGKALSSSEVTYLAQNGLSTQMMNRVKDQVAKHSKNGLLNLDDWSDIDGAGWAVRSAIGNMVRSTIIQPGATTLSASFDNPIIRMLFQFQTFAFASWQKIVVSGVQRHDANFLMAATMLMGLGVAQLHLKKITNGRELPEDYGELLFAAAQETGLGAFPASMYDKFGGAIGAPSTNKMMNIGKAYGGQVGTFDPNRTLGVAVQPIMDIGRILEGTVNGFDQKNIDSARRLLPFNNLWYTSSLFDQVSRASAEGLDIKYKTRDSMPNKFWEGR
jgi:hypothetical protein